MTDDANKVSHFGCLTPVRVQSPKKAKPQSAMKRSYDWAHMQPTGGEKAHMEEIF